MVTTSDLYPSSRTHRLIPWYKAFSKWLTIQAVISKEPLSTNHRRIRKSLFTSIMTKCWRICNLRVDSRRRKPQVEEMRRRLAWFLRSGQSNPQSRTQREFRKSAKPLSIARIQFSHRGSSLRKTINRPLNQVEPLIWQIKYQVLPRATRVNNRVVS